MVGVLSDQLQNGAVNGLAAEAARIEAEKQAKREAHKAAQKQQSQNAKNKKGDK